MSGAAFSFLNAEGLPLRGDILAPAAPARPVIVFVHGFKGFKDWGFWPETARRLGEAGYGVVRFNFAHSGIGSDGQTFSEKELFESGTYSREVSDLRGVLSLLARGDIPGSESLDLSRVGLLGHSRGSVASLHAAASPEFPVASVVLWNPVSSVLWWDEETRRRWRETGSLEVVNSRTRQVFHMKTSLLDDAEGNRDRLDPVANAERVRAPLLCVVAAGDESVAPAQGRRLASAAAERASLHEIPGSGHTFGAAHPFAGSTPALDEAIRASREHFDRTLGSPAAGGAP